MTTEHELSEHYEALWREQQVRNREREVDSFRRDYGQRTYERSAMLPLLLWLAGLLAWLVWSVW